MSVYYPSFNFLGKNSYEDYNLIVAHFDADQGEVDTWLGMDPIYSDSSDGTKRHDYGAKFNSVAVPKITVIKADGTDFTVSEVRNFLKWTTGSRKNSYLELCEWDERENKWTSKFRFLGRTTMAYQQKLDARTVGLIIEFTTVSPFAYSPIQRIERTIDGTTDITIEHSTDDIDTLINLDVSFKNSVSNGSLVIYNERLNEETKINNIASNEIVTLSSNGFIKSDKETRVFGNDFNYVFPRYGDGANMLTVTGHGTITIEYIYYIKIGDCTIDVDVSYSGIGCECSGSTPEEGGGGSGGSIVIEEISWENIINKPNIYTQDEVDAKLLEYRQITTEHELRIEKTEINEQELESMLVEILI